MIRRLLSTRSSPMSSLPRISSAAMVVIGDEVLNGKIKDTNSQYFAQYCFELGINLRRISVIPDSESDIVEVLNDLRKKVDFIVTTGGIGPTHDDITYESIAKAYGLPMELDKETVDRMNKLANHPPSEKSEQSRELKAQLRMATFPKGSSVSRYFVNQSLWVPVVSLDNQVYIFPGIPSLYRQMLEGLRPHIYERVDAPRMFRKYISTTTPESIMASILGDLHDEYSESGVKIGSYPHFNDKRNTISLIGPDEGLLKLIADKIIPQVENGHEISPEEESKSS